jgi:hypothetical protein
MIGSFGSRRVSSCFVVIGLVAGALAALPAAADDGPLTAEQILDRYVEAMGGLDAYDEVENVVARGRMEMVGMGLGGTLTIVQAQPDLFSVEFSSDALGRIRAGTDGELVWEVSDLQGPRLLEGTERDFTVRSSTMDGLVRWRDLYRDTELVGTEKVDDRACYTLAMTPEVGEPETWFIDQESFLLVRMELTIDHIMGRVPVQMTFGDFREVDGFLMPFEASQSVMMQEMRTVIESVEYNVELPEDAFTPPPEVRALVEKQAQAEPEPEAEPEPGDTVSPQ